MQEIEELDAKLKATLQRLNCMCLITLAQTKHPKSLFHVSAHIITLC